MRAHVVADGLLRGLPLPGEPPLPLKLASSSPGLLAPWQLRRIVNETVSILRVCRDLGVETPDFYNGASLKVRCPFGDVAHSDGGHEAAMRIYEDTNGAWCFMEQKLFTPTLLYALSHDVDEDLAAERLIEQYRPELDNKDLWEKLQNWQMEIDLHSLAEALKIYCARISVNWDEVQFEELISSTLLRCLALLDKIQTSMDADLWLVSTKVVMSNAIARRK